MKKKTIADEYKESADLLAAKHKIEFEQLREGYRLQAIEEIKKLYPRCKWRGVAVAENVLRSGVYIYHKTGASDRCIGLETMANGLCYISRTGRRDYVTDFPIGLHNTVCVLEWLKTKVNKR